MKSDKKKTPAEKKKAAVAAAALEKKKKLDAKKKKDAQKQKAKKSEKSQASTKDDDGWFEPAADGVEWLKAEPGKVTRVHLLAKPFHAFCSFIEQNKTGWVKTLAEFEVVKGRLNILEDGYDMELTGKDPQARYIVPVLVYDVKNDGSIGKRDLENVEFSIKLWSMSEPIYRRLLGQYKTWGEDIFHHDLLLTGVEKGTYKFFEDISVSPDCFAESDELSETVEDEWSGYKFAETFKDFVGREYDEDELREKAEIDD